MADPPGRLLARGRTADVWADGPDRVRREYRDGFDATAEAAVMRHLAAHGFPVPVVHEAVGPVLVLGRVRGPTLAQDMAARPWRLHRVAGMLRGLLAALARVPPVAGLPEPFGPGDHLLHLDLHPMNVLLGPAGPVVIDWTNAARGPAAADLAQSWLLVTTSEVPGPAAARPAVRLAQRAVGRRLLPPGDPARDWVPAVAAHRIADPNLTAVEHRRVARLLT